MTVRLLKLMATLFFPLTQNCNTACQWIASICIISVTFKPERHKKQTKKGEMGRVQYLDCLLAEAVKSFGSNGRVKAGYY